MTANRMSALTCWHCLLKAITVTWRPSEKYSNALVGYVHRAKVCGVFWRGGGIWEGKVFFVIGDRLPAEKFDSREDAERWCVETVQAWFAQLDHDEP